MWIERDKPEYVYKYCTAERAAQITRDLSFYFATAMQLNDLFEFRARSLYQEDADSKYRVFAKRLVADGWWSTFQEAFEAVKSTHLDGVEETYTEFIGSLNRMLSNIMNNSAVTCFTSHRNNQRMWGTYGNNHAGAQLEFSTSPDHSRFASSLVPVIYTDTKLGICPSALVTDEGKLEEKLITVFLRVKHVHWKEENEWRLLLLADQAQSPQSRLIPFERPAFTRIFLGPKISPQDENLVREAAQLHNPPVPVNKRKIDDDRAYEEVVGFEQIHSFEQLEYWSSRTSKKS